MFMARFRHPDVASATRRGSNWIRAAQIIVLLSLLTCTASSSEITAFFSETAESFRNPMKGFRPSRFPGQTAFGSHEYATVYKHYIPYTNLEVNENDPVRKIRDWSDSAWAGIEERNIKVIPRIVINYPRTGEWWPVGVPYGATVGERWSSDALKDRLVSFVAKLGQAWDNDPRVAAVEMGLWGYWGEHHIWPDSLPDGGDRIPVSFQLALGQAFKNAFRNKKVMVRYENTFNNFDVGYFWDSFALPNDAYWAEWMQNKGCWPTQMISGEVAYDWGDQTNLGGSPNGTLGSTSNTDYLIQYIKSTHCSSLGWVSDYSPDGGLISANAARVQKELGYRFVITQATFATRVDPGESLSIALKVANRGNAPFYYRWPVKVNLLRSNRSIAWSGTLDTDVRQWMPEGSYDVTGSFVVPAGLAPGLYTLALSVNDPDGDLPSLRFANSNYYSGGFTPIGRVGVGNNVTSQNLGSFDQLGTDTSLRYSLNYYDAWAAAHGLSSEVSDQAADPDGDGLTNAQEFAFGGNPLSPTSSLLDVQRDSGAVKITFLARTTNGTTWSDGSASGLGVNYQLQSATNLAAGFAPVDANITLSNDQIGAQIGDIIYQRWECTIPTNQAARFFRLQGTVTVGTLSAR